MLGIGSRTDASTRFAVSDAGAKNRLVGTDSTARRGICNRQGVGGLARMAVTYLGAQQVFAQKRPQLNNVSTEDMRASVCTQFVGPKTTNRLMLRAGYMTLDNGLHAGG